MRKQELKKITLSPSKVEVEVRGAVVNISSVNGIVGIGLPGYSAAKAGIQAITRNGAQFYGPYGIRVNAISPGSTRTEAFARWVDSLPPEQSKYVSEGIVNSTPLKRQGNPEELANAVSFLLSADSTFVNGHNLTVDGAYTTVKY
jgi:NAD(P)-dependent dehydrogenase (short-subunit alcohol dehydrogenase family)